MLYLLSAIKSEKSTFWLLFCLGILLIVEVAVFAVLLLYYNKRKQTEERSFVGIRLNTAGVRRKYTVGEDFVCNGLIVRAVYNMEPTSENLNYVVLTEQQFKAESEVEPDVCYVVKPNMNEAGKKSVSVYYRDKKARFSISVAKPVEESEKPMAKLQAKFSNAVGAVKSAFANLKLKERIKNIYFKVVGAVKSVFTKSKPKADLSLDKNPECALLSISLDVVIVKRNFVLGEQFNCAGLVVYANYNVKPTHASIVTYQILEQAQYNRLKKLSATVCYVIKPDMSQVGQKVVTVVYCGKTESYTIEVVDQPQQNV